MPRVKEGARSTFGAVGKEAEREVCSRVEGDLR